MWPWDSLCNVVNIHIWTNVWVTWSESKITEWSFLDIQAWRCISFAHTRSRYHTLGKWKPISIVNFIVRLTYFLNSLLEPAVYPKEIFLMYMACVCHSCICTVVKSIYSRLGDTYHKICCSNCLALFSKFQGILLGLGQTPYFTWAELNANEKNPLFFFIKLH